MSRRLVKLTIVTLSIGLGAVSGLWGEAVSAFSNGPPSSHTNAPGEGNCTECHSGNALNSGGGTFTITGLPATYTPNQEITVTVTLTQANRGRYGFQLTVIDDSGKQAGTIVVTDNNRTQLINGQVGSNARDYIEHRLAGTNPSGTNQGSWSFTWRAPAQSVGRVTFYAAGNAANGTGTTAGDFIYTTSASVQAATPVTTVSSASFSGTTLAPEALVTAYGSNLATGTASATTIPLPETLAGTTVKVKDSAGTERTAGLLFVSAGQVNYQIPPQTANGAATVTITSGSGAVSTGTVQIDTVAPGLFTANSNGQGVPAAVAFRDLGGGVTATETVFDLTPAGFVPRPIDLGPESNSVFLILFGTGFRFASALSAVTATIGGTDAPVAFAGPAPGFVGLDQANVRIPRSLVGRGNVDVVLTVNGKPANAVTVNIR